MKSLDPGAVKRHIHKVNVPPEPGKKRIECFLTLAAIAITAIGGAALL